MSRNHFELTFPQQRRRERQSKVWTLHMLTDFLPAAFLLPCPVLLAVGLGQARPGQVVVPAVSAL